MDRIQRLLLAVVTVLVAVTGVSMWVLWPDPAEVADVGDQGFEDLHPGVVRSAERYECPPEDPNAFAPRTGPCQRVQIEILGGPAESETFEIDSGEEDYPEFSTGDRVRVGIARGAGDAPQSYYVGDFARLTPIYLLFALFVAVVLAVGRWHGLRSLVGLGLSLGVVVVFVVPAILAGESPFLVAVVGSLAIMLLTLYLAHGLTVKTTAAVIGTSCALGLTVVLGLLFVELANLTGFSSEEAIFAQVAVEGLDLRGLVLAGLVIAALGVLDDVTVSQASTVFAVYDANPDQTWGEVFRRAMDVGRDHIASTVNTLVLAYVGASIPLVVLFSTSGLPFSEILNAEVVGEEVVKTLVGSLGLVTAVPLTTALATTVARRRPTGDLPVPRHLRDDVDEEDLSEEERDHRRWIDFLRSGETPGEDAPRVPTATPDDEEDDT